MRTILVTIVILFCSFTSKSQIIDDFDDGDLTQNPTWIGNIDHFMTDAEGVLRLNSPLTGKSFIYTSYTAPDSLRLSLQLGLEFSPSASNLLRVYIFIDNPDITKANGYYLNFGENGSDDAIRLYKLINGSSTLLGSGKLGAIAGNNNDIVFELSYDSNQNWKLKANYEGKNVLTQEFVFRDSWSFVKSGFFAIECIYTATRRDKYYFDNLVLDILTPDTIPPTLVSFNAVNERSIQVEFSEEVVAPNASNFSISPPINILSVTSTSSTNTRFELQLLSPLAEGSIYKLTVNNIKDIAGNIAPNFLVEIGLYKGPKIGDVIITELLFDPLSGGEDYIELFNKSEKIINLRLSKIGNPSRNQFITVPRDIFIKPKEHLCFAIDPVWVRNNFKPPTDANIISQALPLFNASDGAASIQNEAGEYLDSIFYNAKQHNKILNNVKGVSLERVINDAGSYENLWTSGVKATNYGTPGYLNANQNGNDQIINNYFSIANKTFSPNGDGIKDEVIINYSLPKPGFVAEVKVFGQDGHLIKTLYKGEFIASQGLLRWDGFNDKGEIERIGVYHINGSVFHAEGERFTFGHSCILTTK